jgi:hypothetical protein
MISVGGNAEALFTYICHSFGLAQRHGARQLLKRDQEPEHAEERAEALGPVLPVWAW